MYNKTIILTSKSLSSLFKVLYQHPGHCHGPSKCGPYGPQGPWAQPLFDCVADALRGVFFGENSVPKKIARIYEKNDVLLLFWTMLT